MAVVAVPKASAGLAGTRRRPALRQIGPNWYATVMGTAIVATAGAGLPGAPDAARPVWIAVWALSALTLLAVLIARTGHWLHHPDRAREHLLDPAVAPFYGCLPMALLAVGAATMAVGSQVIGAGPATALDSVLWTAGTVTGLITTAGVPYLMITRHEVPAGSAAPAWLLPIVPPMVSAAVGPALVPHLPAGQWREAMVFGCYALFGVSLLATLVILPLVFSRLVHYGALPLAATPTLFFVLGPLGQSTTATGKIADAAQGVLPAGYAHAASAFAVLYGVPVLGFALMWLAISLVMVGRAVRAGMPFTMTWWGFTFPLGTCVTGASSLAGHTGLAALRWLAVALFAMLAIGWATAWLRTAGMLTAPSTTAPASTAGRR